MNLAIVLMLVAGVVFVYASVTGKNPRDMIKDALKRG